MQELPNELESEDICAITSPSLQDLLCQELDSNFLLLQKILDLTSPSLQDFEIGAFDHVPFVRADYVPYTLGVDPYIFASNLGFVLSNIAGPPADPFGIGDHLSSFGAANGFS